jgi:tRNA1(Val) A37 N6-methylase TrmN6
VLLAAALAPKNGELVADVGAGTGAVGLMIALRSDARIALVEQDPLLVGLCHENIALNQVEHRVSVIEADVMSGVSDGGWKGSADAVVTNPPFLDPSRIRAPADRRRGAAHIMPSSGSLDRWIRGCVDLLRPKGRLALIHRADRLDDCLRALSADFGGVLLRVVHPRAQAPGIRVLLTATKGSRAPMAIQRPLVLHNPDGSFTAEAAALHQGEDWLS